MRSVVGISSVIIIVVLVTAFSKSFQHLIRTFKSFEHFTWTSKRGREEDEIGSIRSHEENNFQPHEHHPGHLTTCIPMVKRVHKRNLGGRTNGSADMA